MGHRQRFSTSQLSEIEPDWSHGHSAAGQSYIPMGRAVPPQTGCFSHPTNGISTNGLNFASRNNLESGSLEHPSTYFRSRGPQVHPPFSGSPHDVFPRCPAGGNFAPAPELNVAHVHSNHYNRHSIHELEGGSLDHGICNGRGPFKRKSPGVSTSWERAGTSSMYSAGSSSNSFEIQQEKPTSDYTNYFPDSAGLPPYMGGSLSIGDEDTPRNVRGRSRLDMEPHHRRTYLSSYSSHPFSSTSHLPNHSGTSVASLNVDASANEQNHIGVPPAAHGRFQTSVNNSLNHEMNQQYVLVDPADMGRFHHDSILSRNSVPPPQHLHGFHSQAAREVQNSYFRRTIPTRWTDVSSSHVGQEGAALENGQQFLSETHTTRYPRPFSIGGWNSSHRERRPRISVERFQPLPNGVDAHERMGSEALMMLDRSYLYSRNLFDQYRDMRLDVDGMSYEELLALGERIGSVNTGLSEDAISECLIETICPSSEQSQDEASCSICLEEYKCMDKVGTIKNCRHGYHVGCIKKWLSMKNLCPICKAPAVADSSNKD